MDRFVPGLVPIEIEREGVGVGRVLRGERGSLAAPARGLAEAVLPDEDAEVIGRLGHLGPDFGACLR